MGLTYQVMGAVRAAHNLLHTEMGVVRLTTTPGALLHQSTEGHSRNLLPPLSALLSGQISSLPTEYSQCWAWLRMKLGTRTDKQQSMEDKINAVEDELKTGPMSTKVTLCHCIHEAFGHLITPKGTSLRVMPKSIQLLASQVNSAVGYAK